MAEAMIPSQTGAEPSGTRPTLTPEELAPYFPQLEIIECLGRGGMGVVYKARQKSLNRLVALKLLAPERGNDAGFAGRFQKEAQALAKLNHPAIVTVYDFGLAGGFYFLLMEFVDGMNLRQLLQAGRIEAREALAIVPQICDALQYAHDAGIVHRDIKPENILLDRRGHVKVADFGLAKIIHCPTASDLSDVSDLSDSQSLYPETTEASKVVGTPQYMAPEQTEHPASVDHRADIYSLGVVFYQMLTGELPKGDFAPPSKRVVIDVRLDEVVLRALEKRPELRYQQVSDVKTMVESIVASPEKTEGRRQETEGGSAQPDSRDNRRFSLGRGLAGCAVFAVLMGVREEFADIWVRSAIAGLAAGSGFLVAVSRRWFAADATPRFCRTAMAQGVKPGTASTAAFIILYVAYVAMVFTTASGLPERVATHFGFEGRADGWMSRSAYQIFEVALPLVISLIFMGVSALVRFVPEKYVNLPRKDFWLVPERRALTDSIIRSRMMWLACLMMFFFGGLHVLTLEANRVQPPQLPMGGLLLVVMCFLIALMTWVALLLMRFAKTGEGAKEVPQPSVPPRTKYTAKLIGICCVVVAIMGLVVIILSGGARYGSRNSKIDSEKRRMHELQANTSKLKHFDWKDAEAEGQPLSGMLVTMDGAIALKIENAGNAPLLSPILKCEWPVIAATHYAITGEVKYENVQGTGYLEMWSHFSQAGQYFTRTLDVPGSGPMAVISGTSDWRVFSLPFDRSGTTNAISKLEVNLYLPAKGVVYLRLVALAQTVNKNQAAMPISTVNIKKHE